MATTLPAQDRHFVHGVIVVPTVILALAWQGWHLSDVGGAGEEGSACNQWSQANGRGCAFATQVSSQHTLVPDDGKATCM